MFTLGYSFKPWTEPKAIADGPRILNYVRETAADNGIDQKIRFNHRVKRASWSSQDARWTVEAERGPAGEGGAELVRFTCNFLFMCSGYYKYEEGYTPEFPGAQGFRRPHRASAEMDRRHRLRRQARGGDRLRRYRGDAGAGDGQEGRARHHAAAFADLCGLAPGAGPGRQQIARAAAEQARLSSDPLAQRAVGHVFLPALPAQAGAGQAADPRRRQDGARSRLRHRHPFHAALQSLGSAAVPGARRRSVQGDQGEARLGGDQPDRHLHRKRHPAEGRQRARGRHHRHRDRPEFAGARRPRGQRRRPHGRFRARR